MRGLAGHQIRAHLASTAHPIANDALYGGPFQPDGARPLYGGDADGALRARLAGAAVPWCKSCRWVLRTLDAAIEQGEAAIAAPAAGGAIWLHALEYRLEFDGESLCFVAPPPGWAAELLGGGGAEAAGGAISGEEADGGGGRICGSGVVPDLGGAEQAVRRCGWCACQRGGDGPEGLQGSGMCGQSSSSDWGGVCGVCGVPA